ncbi:uncharacterized protein LOC116618796 isoform X1 [Nematostella vectensis]|uniref:uncharacterized protein LOC116618796 isoform X1 n=1 Tax=Nematostella vectensis TaxID=45351 RepID=UPI0020772F7D|nr:uncharacterized protein LOC116618796 isoform X1 [Nematostella vectensis]XP_032238799.2 uncharacterized protein LOC116618796 isoform X1 [Nematostella vectensis]
MIFPPSGRLGHRASCKVSVRLVVFAVAACALCITVYEWNTFKQVTAESKRWTTVSMPSLTTRTSDPSNPKRELRAVQILRRKIASKFNKTSVEIKRKILRERLCGTEWQEEYAQLHKDILEGRKPPRFLVFYCGGVDHGCGGYGNRIGGITSLLYLAVLTERAFIIHWHSSVSLENYFLPRSIRWNLSIEKLRDFKKRAHFWGRGNHVDVNGESQEDPGLNAKDFQRWIQDTDLNAYLSYPVEMVTSQWYFAQSVRMNRFLKRRNKAQFGIKERGHRYSLVGCASDYLFSRTSYIKQLLTRTKTSLGFDKKPTIGIHFRTGDYALLGRKAKPKSLRVAEKFLECAKKLEKVFLKSTLGLKSADVNWFLATDSYDIKAFVSKRYPKVVYQEVKLEHISKTEPSANGLEGVILDHLLLSESDAIILSNSSFSQSALGLGFHSLRVSTFGTNCQY